MSNHVASPLVPAPNQAASSSSHPHSLTPASYHPYQRPAPIPPFHRIDTHQIKQQLHDALGEAGLPYWKALNGYLLGQVGREELTSLVRGWLKGKHLLLHNKLLYSLLHNASSPQITHQPSTPLILKRRRGANGVLAGGIGGAEPPDFDQDESFIESRTRVHRWVMAMGGRERARVRRIVDSHEEEAEAAEVDLAGAGAEWDTIGRQRKWSSAFQSNPTHPPLAQSARLIPSSHQLAQRLSQLAKSWGLDLSPDAMSDIGEFMAVGMDAHLADVLHGIVHLTGRERPGLDTIRVPHGTRAGEDRHDTEIRGDIEMDGVDEDDEDAEDVARVDRETALPQPTLETLQYLFTLAPSLHPQASPTLYKLMSSFTLAEVENASPPGHLRREGSFDPPHTTPVTVFSVPPATTTGASPQQQQGKTLNSSIALSPVKSSVSLSALHGGPGHGKTDSVSQILVSSGLLKLDKAGRAGESGDGGGAAGEAERKRDKKHNFHWKYEDPALILKDVLG